MTSVCFALRRRLLQRVLLPLIAAAALAGLPAPPAGAVDTSATTLIETRLTDLVNADRARAGLPGLRIDVRLVAPARAWSARMAASGSLAHDPDAAAANPAGVTTWAENVGRTSEPDAAAALHAGFMASPAHRSIMLDGRFSDVGVGVARGDDALYATQHFTGGAPARISSAVQATADLARALFADGGAQRAVIVRDDLFPDALASGPLAGSLGPILLTPPGGVLYPHVRLALEEFLPAGATVWIVGGNAAVDSDVEAELAAAGWRVRRIWGGDRVDTAAAVARAIAERDGRPDTALLATAGNWADAAAGGGFGARTGSPVLLTHVDELPGATADALSAVAPRRVAVLGGADVVSDRVAQRAGAARVDGLTRQDTAAAVARDLWGRSDAASAPAWTVVPADGEDAWTWALAAAPLAARVDAPILLAARPLSDGLRAYLDGLGYGNGRSAALHPFGPVGPALDDLAALTR